MTAGFLDRIATQIRAFEGESQVVWFGSGARALSAPWNFTEYLEIAFPQGIGPGGRHADSSDLMSDSTDPNPPPEPPEVEVSQAGERDAALAAVIREQTEKAEVEVHAREVRVRRQGLGLRHLALSIVAAISVWIWIWPPSVLRIVPPPPPPLEEEEATLRLVMYFQAQKIEQYLLDTGRVPLVLDDAGPAFRGMEYVRLTNSDYRILGRTGRVTLSYSSVEPLDMFVGAGVSALDPLVFN